MHSVPPASWRLPATSFLSMRVQLPPVHEIPVPPGLTATLPAPLNPITVFSVTTHGLGVPASASHRTPVVLTLPQYRPEMRRLFSMTALQLPRTRTTAESRTSSCPFPVKFPLSTTHGSEAQFSR